MSDPTRDHLLASNLVPRQRSAELDRELQEQIWTMHLSGCTDAQIRQALGAHRRTVKKVVDNGGPVTAATSGPEQGADRAISDRLALDIKRQFFRMAWDYGELSHFLDAGLGIPLSDSRIRQYMREFPLVFPPAKPKVAADEDIARWAKPRMHELFDKSLHSVPPELKGMRYTTPDTIPRDLLKPYLQWQAGARERFSTIKLNDPCDLEAKDWDEAYMLAGGRPAKARYRVFWGFFDGRILWTVSGEADDLIAWYHSIAKFYWQTGRRLKVLKNRLSKIDADLHRLIEDFDEEMQVRGNHGISLFPTTSDLAPPRPSNRHPFSIFDNPELLTGPTTT